MKNLAFVGALLAVAAGSFAVSATLTPRTSFSGDGYLAPGEHGYTWLGTAHLERGLAYNPVTGNILVLSRLTTPQIRIIDPTGAFVGVVPNGTGIITGGVFLLNMVDVDQNGIIYAANLITSAPSAFRVYRWASETSVPTVAFHGVTGRTRVGDSFDLRGVGPLAEIVTSGGLVESGFVHLTTTDGLAFSGGQINVGPAGDFRLGITFAGPGEAWGTRTNFPMRRASYFPTVTDLGTSPLTTLGEAPMDFAVINNVPILATIDIGNSFVRIYDVTNPAAPVRLVENRAFTGTPAVNTNGTGQVRITQISGSSAVVYAMSTNQGIQAFDLTISPSRTVSGTIALQGRAPGSGVLVGVQVEAQLRQGTTVVDTQTVTLDDNGAYTLSTNAPAGIYDIRFKPAFRHMAQIATGVDLRGASATANPAELPAGDVTGDNRCDIDDFLAVAGTYEVSPPTEINADFTGDGSVDIDDFLLLAGNYETAGPD